MSFEFQEEKVDPEIQKALEDMRKNEECIVAYLDILGYKDLVNKFINPKKSTDKDILNIIISAFEEAKKPLNNEFNNLNLVNFKQFSDCACLSIPGFYGMDSEAALLGMFLILVKNFYFYFVRKNLYLRGGVSIGFHYEDENIIFSDGLIKAYFLESKKSIYPRIILDSELVKRIKRLWDNQKNVISDFGIEKLILIDWEGTSFINPFSPTQSMGNIKPNDSLETNLQDTDKIFHMEIKRNLDKKIAKHKLDEDNHILSKYLWLNELLNWNINPESSTMKFEYLLK